MSRFLFNEFDSDGSLIITKPILRPSWAQEVKEITTGSVTKIIQMSRTYSNTPLMIQTVIENTSPDVVNHIYASLRGIGRLTLSSDPTVYMNAAASILQPDTVALTMAEMNIGFTLLPFAYAVNPTVVQLNYEYTEINNTGTVFSAPEIRFTPTEPGEVSIIVNGMAFIIRVPEHLTGTEIIVDSDSQVAYIIRNDVIVSVNQYTYNDFPLLHTGLNYVKCNGAVSGAAINVRERWY